MRWCSSKGQTYDKSMKAEHKENYELPHEYGRVPGPVVLPQDIRRGQVSVTVSLPAGLKHRLHAYARRHGQSVDAAVEVLLSRALDQFPEADGMVSNTSKPLRHK